ncbi:MAG: Uma2 family endonuclease [Trueperaceae bacterium]
MNTSMRFSYEDLLQLQGDGKRHEIIGGELYTMPLPSPEHRRIVLRFVNAIYIFLQHLLDEVFVSPN